MKVRFDEFTFDADSRQLHRGADELHLSRKAFDLLSMLLERRPGVVDKETLRERLWGGTVVVEANLNNLVSEIRTALQDDPLHPRFIRTVHRVGYAFSGTVSEEPEPAPHAGDRSPRFWLIWNDRSIAITASDVTVGRDPESTVWIDVPGVSRRHAMITLATNASGTTALIEDLGSTNGTFVNGRRVTREVALDDGSTIAIGEATLTFRTSSSIDTPTKRIPKRRRP
jgi:DNA-binding winged helix-turn-helix (wHTH) protein